MPDVDLSEDTPGASQTPSVTGVAEREFFDADRASHEHKMRQLELGWIGKPFGGGAEKAGNIAIIAIAVCLLVAVAIALNPEISKNSDLFTRDLTPFISIVTLALGYIFGAGKTK